MSDLTPERVRELLDDYEIAHRPGMQAFREDLRTPEAAARARDALCIAAPDLARAVLQAWKERDEARVAALREAASLLDAAEQPLHPDPAIRVEVEAERDAARTFDGAAGLQEGWHRGWTKPAEVLRASAAYIERGEHSPDRGEEECLEYCQEDLP